MSYQERIYSQNGKCDRNFVGPVPTTSSDICVFNRPAFIMSGASSIDCPEATCDISGTPYNDLFTGATDCFTFNELSGSCFNSIDWTTNVYEDNVLVYSNAFYSSSGLTGPVIGVTEFSGSVVTAFDTLEYDYSFNGTEFTIDGSDGKFNNLKLELTTELDYDLNCQVTGNTTGDTSCSCPVGYTATTANDNCQQLTTSVATFNGLGSPIVGGSKSTSYGGGGAYFYPDISEITDLPITRTSNSSYLVTSAATQLHATNNTPLSNSFWSSQYTLPWPAPSTTKGRLNNVSIKSVASEWRGFSDCIDIPVEKVYYIGIAGDNFVRLKVDGVLVLELGPPTAPSEYTLNFWIWHVLPYKFTSGKHIIELYGRDGSSSPTAFGAEIYDPTDLATLTAATNTTEAGVFFTTADKLILDGVPVTTYWDLGDTVGYSCPATYGLDTCGGGTPVCTLIENEPITCLFTGDCATNESTVCDLDFSGLTVNSTNVHVLTGDTEQFDLTFEFTANTESFDTTNAKFKYEIYKYVPDLGYFNNTPEFISEYFDWSTISGTSAFTTSITANTINPDGQYIVKGQYVHDICTEFATLLGYKNTTSLNYGGESYGQYQPSRDFYFVAFKEPEKPQLAISSEGPDDLGNLVIDSIILDGTETEFNLPGSVGDYVIALNGLTLAATYDYSVSSVDLGNNIIKVFTLSGGTVSGDVLTYTYISGQGNTVIKSDAFDINTAIVSGTTNNQGSNTVYYNTTEGKYEVYLSMTPINSGDIGITLNGASLAIGIDYYQSTTNPRRIIFDAPLIINDIVNAYYITNTNILGDQFGTSIQVSWTIETPPSQVNGIFTVEISSDVNFTTIVSSATTEYTVGSTGYDTVVNLVGVLGDKQYYRVKNEKNFVTLCNETLSSSAYSEIANITIQSNVNNSY